MVISTIEQANKNIDCNINFQCKNLKLLEVKIKLYKVFFDLVKIFYKDILPKAMLLLYQLHLLLKVPRLIFLV